MPSKIELSSPSNGLGDILLLTAVCKNLLARGEKATVVLPPQIQRFSILFDGLADVEIREPTSFTPDIGGGHYATRKLRNFFQDADLLDNRPLVLHSDPESEQWAEDFLQNKKGSIIFVPYCAKQWHHVRSFNLQKAVKCFDQLLEMGYQPIICESSNNPSLIRSRENLIDLPLSKYISLLRRVGSYFGCNTGDFHLAAAVGAYCTVFQPQNHPLFNREEWDYKSSCIDYLPL